MTNAVVSSDDYTAAGTSDWDTPEVAWGHYEEPPPAPVQQEVLPEPTKVHLLMDAAVSVVPLPLVLLNVSLCAWGIIERNMKSFRDGGG